MAERPSWKMWNQDPLEMSPGELCKLIRDRLIITQEELAKKLRMHVLNIRRWETGVYKVARPKSRRKLVELARKVLGHEDEPTKRKDE